MNLHRLIHAIHRFNELAKHSYTYRFIRHARNQWHERFTATGRLVLLAATFTAMSGSFPEAVIGATLFSSFIALTVTGLALAGLRPPKASARRTVASRCAAGARAPLSITIRNDTKRPLYDVGAYEFRFPEGVSIAEPLRYTTELAPGESHSFEYTLTADRRGDYALPGPSVVSAFPFGLAHAKRFCAEATRLIVYPRFRQLTRLNIPAGRRYQPGGIVLASHVGESMEFVGTRPYQQGDRLRDLHPRSWARVGYPVVRQYQEEFLTRVAILVDTFVPPRAVPPPRLWGKSVAPDPLEASLSASAAIADYLARQEYIVDLFAAGPELYHFQAGRSLGYLDNILDILACINACPRDPLAQIGSALSRDLEQVSTVIAVLLDWDPARAEFVRKVQSAGAQIKVVLISDHHTESDLAGIGIESRVISVKQAMEGVEEL